MSDNRIITLRYVVVGEAGERRASFPISEDAVVSVNEMTRILASRHPGKEIRIVKWSGRSTIEDLPAL